MIKVHDVSKSFGNLKALDHISFEVKEAETLVLLGTSGCGKTTTLKMINRLIRPTSGNILINDQHIKDQSPTALRRNIGYVLQSNGLFPHYTVAQNIGIVPHLLKWDKKRIEIRTDELLEKLHLSKKHLPMYPHELSGGQQQRVGLARALAANPPILLMDEPLGALDNVTRSKIHTEFKALDELKRKTIMMVTHDVQEAFTLGNRICLMDKGKIIQNGTPRELLFKPANAFVENFLKEQRLQLEFKTACLADLWNWLPAGNVHNDTETLGADTDVWTALESFQFKQTDTLTILDRQRDEIKRVAFEQLMFAFYQYKKNQAT